MKRYVIIGPIALLVLWLAVSYLKIIDRLLVPPPVDVAVSLFSLFSKGIILSDLGWTLLRWMSGLLIGVVVGIPLGLLMGASEKLYASLEVLVDFFRSIPVMATFPLFLILFGIGEKSNIAISAWTTILYVVINTLYGVRHRSESRRMVARVFRATQWQTFTKVILPEALPHIFVGMRISISMSLVLVVAAEMIMGANFGLGKRIFDSAITYDTSQMYAAIIVAGVLGYLSNRLFVSLERRVIHWAAT